MPSRFRYGANAAAAVKPSCELSWSRYVTSGAVMLHGAPISCARSSLLAPKRRLRRQPELEQEQRPRGDLVDFAGHVVVVGGLRKLGELRIEHERPKCVLGIVAGCRQSERHGL